MRFIAAFSVFAFHAFTSPVFASPAWNMLPVPGEYAKVFWQGNWAGVSFFFILSGFVLTWSARGTDTAGAFWRRRIFKIYPNHLLTLAAALILFGGVMKIDLDAKTVALNGLLVQAFFPQQEIWASYNSVSWSLSHEAFFYLLFPFLLPVVMRIRPSRLWLWAGVVVGAILVIPLVATLLPAGQWQPFTQSEPLQFWFVSKFPPVRLLEFVFGMIMARVVLSGRRVPLGLWGAAALNVVAYAVAPLFPLTYPQVAVMVLPLGLLIAAGAVADVRSRPTWLGSRVMVWLGNISFAFYMSHLLVLLSSQFVLGPGGWSLPVGFAVIGLLFGVTVVVSWLMYALFEAPIMRRFAVSRRRRREPVPSAPKEARTPVAP
ncbi:MAG TPA: acyltransferase [Nonomuraea sp.]|nr:acyltransferase [Nonomuraea sp.]